jgi:surface polysaccharide O-acyltransferase-like enzyme
MEHPEPAIYKVTLGGSISNSLLGVYVVADNIDDALSAANEFIARFPWKGEQPTNKAIQLEYVADFVIVHNKYL